MNSVYASLLLLSLVLIIIPTASSAEYTEKDLKEAAVYARKLVNENTWGVISNNAYNLNNIPFGNIVSYADGGTGIPYFYLTTLDYTSANYSMIDQRTSLTVGQIALGTCGIFDPQDPICGKVTLSGLLKPVRAKSREEQFALKALFQRHQRFNDLGNFAINFKVYKLEVKSIYVINGFKAPTFPSRKYYLNAN